MVFGGSTGYGYLLLYRGIGYKLLLVMVRKKAKQRKLDLRFLFLEEKMETYMIGKRVDY